MKCMIEDRRAIKAIKDSTGAHDIARVGSWGITKIETYQEEYNENVIPFIAVYRGDNIDFRMPARDISIFY